MSASSDEDDGPRPLDSKRIHLIDPIKEDPLLTSLVNSLPCGKNTALFIKYLSGELMMRILQTS
jgi:hypothetical protein